MTPCATFSPAGALCHLLCKSSENAQAGPRCEGISTAEVGYLFTRATRYTCTRRLENVTGRLRMGALNEELAGVHHAGDTN